jgi:ribose 5-phosphate isomerase A
MVDASQNSSKKMAAIAALEYVVTDEVIGVGTGSTVNYFVEALVDIKHKIQGAVATSSMTEKLLREKNIPICDLNSVGTLSLYVDGADEINDKLQMIKGGGGALTREKIVAACAAKFVCIADSSKKVSVLGEFPLPIEVIPMARSFVAREIVKLGGSPVYREGFITDNDNVILDVWGLKIFEPAKLEMELNNITGVVCNGIFARRSADALLLGTASGVETVKIEV